MITIQNKHGNGMIIVGINNDKISDKNKTLTNKYEITAN